MSPSGSSIDLKAQSVNAFFPISSIVDGSVTDESVAQEVNAGRAGSANAVLCSDIDLGEEEWTPIGKNYSSAFKGSFDGQGHTVSGLSITGSASSNTGLFGYVDSATIENVTVQGSISLTGNGSSSYGAGGIAGQLYGKAGAIRNCRSDVTVHGGQNVGGIVG